jgi:hypothetical protein
MLGNKTKTNLSMHVSECVSLSHLKFSAKAIHFIHVLRVRVQKHCSFAPFINLSIVSFRYDLEPPGADLIGNCFYYGIQHSSHTCVIVIVIVICWSLITTPEAYRLFCIKYKRRLINSSLLHSQLKLRNEYIR